MAKITIPNISSGYLSTTALNNAFDSIETELNNKVLYRNNPDGEPNQMENDIDMNGYKILNASSVDINGVDLGEIANDIADAAEIFDQSLETVTTAADNAAVSAAEAEASAAIVADWSYEGSWITSKNYKKNNIVTQSGNSYICLVDHTSSVFSTDLIANKWQLFAEKGAAGAGTGDMLGSNNLSDVTSVTTSRANLGLGVLATKGDGDKGDIIVSNSGDTWTLDNNTVDTNKLQNNAVTGDKVSTTLVNSFATTTPALGDLIPFADISNSNTNGKATVENIVKTGLNSVGNPPVYGCRAWVNFNGTGTVAIRASGNVSSITDNGTGDYTVNFTTAMPDANYAVAGITTGRTSTNTAATVTIACASESADATLMSTTQLRVITGRTESSTLTDKALISISIFR